MDVLTLIALSCVVQGVAWMCIIGEQMKPSGPLHLRGVHSSFHAVDVCIRMYLHVAIVFPFDYAGRHDAHF